MYGFVDTIESAGNASLSINTIFNGITLDDALTDDTGSFRTLTVSGRGDLYNKIVLEEMNNQDGAIERDGDYSDVAEIIVKFKLSDNTNEGFRDRIIELKRLLGGRKHVLEFTDKDLFYYASLSELVFPEEDSNDLVGEMLFLCSDPIAYSKEEKTIPAEDIMMINNEGNEATEPIIELTATKKATFAMVNNVNDEYNLLGFPLEEGSDEIVEERTLTMNEDGSTLSSWHNDPVILDENFNIGNGSLTGDVTGIYASNYGSSTEKNHGGYKIKTLPESLEDFRVETHFDLDTPNVGETLRVEIYLIAEDMSIIGKMGMLDGSPTLKQRIGLVRAGEYVGYGKNYTHYSGNYNHDRVGSSQTWYLRFIREGNEIRTRVARRLRGKQVRGKNGRLLTTRIDNADKPLRYIGVYIGYYKETTRPRLARINHIDVYKLNKVEEDQTPYILYEGDTVTFDHAMEEILINGEDSMMLKDFGAEFFKLPKGYSQIEINPPDTFTGEVRFREKYK